MTQGLEGIVVARTTISEVDGSAGRIVVRGRELGDLVDHGFEAMCSLLWEQSEPLVAAALQAARQQPHPTPTGDVPIDVLRASIASMPPESPPPAITGTMAVALASWAAARRGDAPPVPHPGESHAAYLHRGLTGRTSRREAHALDAYLATVAEHGLNASTFTARVVASTQADDVCAVTAAIGALKGPLHGGAPGPVLDMLDAVAEADDARAWVDHELTAGRRIMGMGHRVYRVRDPRAAALEGVVHRLDPTQICGRVALAREVERAAETALAERHPTRPLLANVEFYTAVLLEALHIPRVAFSAVFACARVAGWCAHTAEQRANGRMMRPRAQYVGTRCPGPRFHRLNDASFTPEDSSRR